MRCAARCCRDENGGEQIRLAMQRGFRHSWSMMTPRNLALAVTAPFCWGTGFTLAKPAVAQFSPLFMMLIVYVCIGTALLLTTRNMPKTPWPKLLVISALSVTIQGAMLFSAIAYVDATTANLVLQTQVPAAIFLGWLVAGEALDGRKIIGTAIALVGVAIVIGLPEQRPPLLPVLVIIAAGIVWALGQVLTRTWSVDSGLIVLKANALFAVPQLLVATLVLEQGQWDAVVTANAYEWFCMAFIIIVGFYIAYVSWFTLLTRVRVDEAAPFVLLMTPIGVLAAVLFLGETLSVEQIAGGAVLLLGLAVVTGVIGRRAA
jgi:O-acetylserine/cysteine efflux transporter